MIVCYCSLFTAHCSLQNIDAQYHFYNLGDPVAGKDNDETDERMGNAGFAGFGLFGAAGAEHELEAAGNEHKEEDEAGENKDVF